jgi:hypothetical protein
MKNAWTTVTYSNTACSYVLALTVYAEALQEIRDSCTHINEFGGLLACELAKYPGGLNILKAELTAVAKTALSKHWLHLRKI